MGIKSFQGKRAAPEKEKSAPMLVRDYMSTSLITFKEHENIMDVAEKLTKNKISGGCVVDDNNKLLGLISEGDCMKQISDSRYYNMPLDNATVGKRMTCNVDTIDGNMNVMDAAKLFIEKRFRRFPIVEHGKLIGQISQSDVLRAAVRLKSNNWHLG
ncbi:CBS domain-containing protein [Salegentibacter mishustinae]|uniref:Inosine-5-monophosphate dehydrogenase n=1 Tax=Salegentibacter mishustinae TaxID=270918 RepID=A0A0Q9ZCL8_9FLAO|nr:CBS domain-containing protein [Salegentibacter mishustinae]KRG27858.1 inosine-5-monophosphate dehydrogenase [Salegentibacter mishustinae]PNW20926.1 inosine-5-monophosphate dehydrogenase [Salegentibacter mishustinae]PZX64057.1 CBS domain protein [Salegentibacter mishustinae]GGW89875.1 CBS domain-containing protein [Salegentibacter mishustinae]